MDDWQRKLTAQGLAMHCEQTALLGCASGFARLPLSNFVLFAPFECLILSLQA